MDDDLNTAQAQAAAFEFVRQANTWIAAGEFRADNVVDARRTPALFDEVFDVLTAGAPKKLAAEEVEKFLAERVAVRQARDYARADRIRDGLREQDVIIEDTRSGTTWRYADR